MEIAQNGYSWISIGIRQAFKHLRISTCTHAKKIAQHPYKAQQYINTQFTQTCCVSGCELHQNRAGFKERPVGVALLCLFSLQFTARVLRDFTQKIY